MLIFGTRSKILDGPQLRGHSCSSCGQGEHASFGAIRYFHIFWIPVFPFSKTVGVQCANCKHTVTGKDVPGVYQDTIKSAMFTRNKMLPLFTGSVLIAGLAGLAMHTVQQDGKRELEYIQNPATSDVYIMDFSQVFEEVDDDYKFGIMRVEAVHDATVEFSVSNYGYDKSYIPATDLTRDMAGDDFFSPEIISFTRAEMVALKEDNIVRDIRR